MKTIIYIRGIAILIGFLIGTCLTLLLTAFLFGSISLGIIAGLIFVLLIIVGLKTDKKRWGICYCTNCNEVNSNDSNYCKDCGSKLEYGTRVDA